MLSGADIKRQIIENANENIRKRKIEKDPGLNEGEELELGNSLETMTKTSGWSVVEDFMLARMNLVGMAVSESVSEVTRGVAKGYVELMQMVQWRIKRKNEIEEKERLKHETKTIPEDQKVEGE
jgi:hypothetical protein